MRNFGVSVIYTQKKLLILEYSIEYSLWFDGVSAFGGMGVI